MKNTFFKFCLVCFFLLSDFIVFAQLPVDDEDGDLQGDDPIVPINGKLFWLGIAGVLFAIYTYKNRKLQTK